MKNTKNNITELVFILDRSGSMCGLESDTIGGFNSLIEKQRKNEGICYVTTVLFNDELKTIHDRLPLDKVKKMTEEDYSVGGCTALIDAIGSTVNHISEIHKYIRPEDVPDNTMFVITTDGLENASRSYDSNQVKKMINERKSEYGWEFIFIGANIDAVETARGFGISSNRAVNYRCDGRGTGIVFNTISNAVSQMRDSDELDDCCLSPIAMDYEERSDE